MESFGLSFDAEMNFDDLPTVIHIIMCPFIATEDLPNLCIASKQFNINARVLYLPNGLSKKIRDPALLGFGAHVEDKEEDDESPTDANEVSMKLNLFLQKNTHTVRVSFPLNYNYGICNRTTNNIQARIEDGDGNTVVENASRIAGTIPFRSSLDFNPRQEMEYVLSIKFQDKASRYFYMNDIRIEALVYGTDFAQLYKTISDESMNWDVISSFFSDEKISHQVKKQALQYQFDLEDNTLLHKCCSEIQPIPDKVVPTLVKIGQRDAVISTNRSGFTPLHEASKLGHIHAMASLIEIGGDEVLMAKDKVNCTPLHFACLNGEIEAMEILVDAGGKDVVLCADCLGSTPLHTFIKSEKVNIAGAKLLVNVGGTELLMSKDCSDNTALTYACRSQMGEMMSLFIERGGKGLVMDIIEGFDKAQSIEDFLQEKESLSQSDVDELIPMLMIHGDDGVNDF